MITGNRLVDTIAAPAISRDGSPPAIEPSHTAPRRVLLIAGLTGTEPRPAGRSSMPPPGVTASMYLHPGRYIQVRVR